jgi:3-methyladenine DNA glycosylase AlkD
VKPPVGLLVLRALRRELVEAADPARAPAMQAYMKSAMPYHGVPAPVARAIHRKVFQDLRFETQAAWRAAVEWIWTKATHREERYAAIALVEHRLSRPFQTPEALPLYERMIVEGAWWDYVDTLASHAVGGLLRAHPAAIRPRMLAWSRDPDLWKRRTAILCQLASKRATDRELLYAVIEPSLASPEFFLKKAIGWALRQYAWVEPDAVRRYVHAHAGELSPLSRREAVKHLADPPDQARAPGR